ncbi:hypothetical protein [Streptomyces sp. NEAU-W12]|uniref:hypothetical protein n=1 Tax=Streptomyces sp. NEAU-W12 TaxID=2994668 RepID=UPI00224A6FC6|nr:hypothetical protein [Streptomyces sp. NEAU-W12]MCX2925341.1 hypothetical protein [Streptomyces sp. NEAU-W12]
MTRSHTPRELRTDAAGGTTGAGTGSVPHGAGPGAGAAARRWNSRAKSVGGVSGRPPSHTS